MQAQPAVGEMPPVDLEQYNDRPHPAIRFTWTARMLLFGLLLAGIVAGGPLVRVMAIAGSFLAILYDVDGLTRHLLRFGSAVVALLLARAFGEQVGIWLEPMVGSLQFGRFGIGTIVVGVGTFLIGMVLTHVISSKIRKNVWLRAVDHVGGASLGVIEGAAAIVIFYWTLGVAAPMIERTIGGHSKAAEFYGNIPFVGQLTTWHATLKTDPAAAWLDEHNVIEQLPQVASVKRVTALLDDKEALTAIAESPDLRQVLKQSDLQALLKPLAEDPKLMQAVERRDIAGVLNHPRVVELMDDPGMQALVDKYLPDVRTALHKTGNERLIEEAKNLTTADLNQLRDAAEQIAQAAEVTRLAR